MRRYILIRTAVFLSALGALIFYGPPLYNHQRELRAVIRAQDFLQRGDYNNASLTARQALRFNPQNVQACTVLARLAELAGSPQLLDWRRRIAQLSPTSENKLNLVSAALRLELPPCLIAAQTLDSLESTAKGCARFHALSAELALKLNKLAEAETHFLEACRLEPTNRLYQLNLAVLRLSAGRLKRDKPLAPRSPIDEPMNDEPFSSSSDGILNACNLSSADSACEPRVAGRRLSLCPGERVARPRTLSFISAASTDAAEARAVLERLATDTTYALPALRSLVGDALARNDLAAAERYSNHLLDQPLATLEDRLRHLTILRDGQAVDFNAFLQSVQNRASTNAQAVYLLSSWMTANRMAGAALNWLTKLPAEVQSAMPVPLAMGDALSAQRQWIDLEHFLAGKTWDQFEFVRFAWLSRAAWEQSRSQAAEAHWRMAILQAGHRLRPLTWLLSMAHASGQPPEQVLWRIVHQFPNELWAGNQLHRFYASRGNTSALNLLCSELAACQPENFVAKNNFATTSMLLKRNLAKAHEIARDLYLQKPDDPVIASTYAYSLHLRARTRDGLIALEKCPTAALQTPAVALYYGVLLAADGQTNKAATFLALAQSANLLPEEQRLAIDASNAPGRSQPPTIPHG